MNGLASRTSFTVSYQVVMSAQSKRRQFRLESRKRKAEDTDEADDAELQEYDKTNQKVYETQYLKWIATAFPTSLTPSATTRERSCL